MASFFGKFFTLAAAAGAAAAAYSYYRQYHDFHKDLEEEFHDFEDETEEEMSSAAAEAYAKFMETDLYKDYAKEYDTFIRKNPGYEDKIAGKLN